MVEHPARTPPYDARKTRSSRRAAMPHSLRADAGTPVIGVVDPVWTRLRQEAEAAGRPDPPLGGFLVTAILNHDRLEAAIVHRVAARLGHPSLPADLIEQTYLDAVERDPAIGEAFRADIMAVADRDPACTRYLEPALYFKGFHAIQTHRLAHWLWRQGRQDFALY